MERPGVSETFQREALESLDACFKELVPVLTSLLQSVEWSATEKDEWGVDYNACPSCQGGDPDDLATPPGERGHRNGCRLLDALAKAEAL